MEPKTNTKRVALSEEETKTDSNLDFEKTNDRKDSRIQSKQGNATFHFFTSFAHKSLLSWQINFAVIPWVKLVKRLNLNNP